MVCALGAGIDAVAHAAFAGDTAGMRPLAGWVADRALTLGAVAAPLPAIPETFAPHHHSRNNQLLLAAAAQIEPQLRGAIARHGAHRVAVVLGTSTSGVNDNAPAFRALAASGAWPADYDYRRQALSSPAEFLAEWLGAAGRPTPCPPPAPPAPARCCPRAACWRWDCATRWSAAAPIRCAA